jgi:hypothetical protein
LFRRLGNKASFYPVIRHARATVDRGWPILVIFLEEGTRMSMIAGYTIGRYQDASDASLGWFGSGVARVQAIRASARRSNIFGLWQFRGIVNIV